MSAASGPPTPSQRPKRLSADVRPTMPMVETRGRKLAPWEDFYHWVLTLTWPRFFGWLTVAYFLVNLLFGFAYWLLPNAVANATAFFDYFFFSVETFATIGYGEMTPVGRAGHVIVTLEAFAGILATATITGVTFARLARPTAKVLFSEKCIIAKRNGVPTLMFRMANWRRNQIAEARLAVMILLTETSQEGEVMRRPQPLKLVRNENPMFLFTWTAMHTIDEESPFYGEDAIAKLREMRAEIFLSLTGLDDTFAQTIHTRYRYTLDDIVQNARFADVLLGFAANGVRTIDYDKFHEIEPLARRRHVTTRRGDGFLHRHIDVGDITMHVVEARPAGMENGVHDDVPLVVFMHGFPELWWSWRRQLIAFAEAGYWAVAPDMRGYNESGKPKGASAYEVEKLAGDIDGLVRALGRRSAIIVGHDWGAVVAWRVAEQYPALVERLAILNVPHPLSMMKGLKKPAQLLKSWYVFFFQLPLLPERLMRIRDFEVIRAMFRDDGIPSDDLEPYIQALKMPGAVTSMMNYYRAAMRRVFTGNTPKVVKIECPVLVIWGDRDRALSKEMADPPKRFVPNARVVHIPEATHWVQNVAPDEVNRLLLEFSRER